MKIKFVLLCILMLVYSISFSQTWQHYITLQGSGTTSMQMNSDGDLFFTTASFNYPSGQSAGVYRIINGSALTTNISPTIAAAYNARTIETEGNYVWVSYWGNPSTQTEGLYYSTNKGDTWTNTFSTGMNNNIFSIAVDPDNDNVFIGTRNGVYKSTDNGLNFTLSNNGMAANSWTYDLEKTGGKFLAATSNGLYQSSNAAGSDWQIVAGLPPGDTPKTIAVANLEIGDIVIAATNYGRVLQYTLGSLTSVFNFANCSVIASLGLSALDDYILFTSAFPRNTDLLPGTGLYFSRNDPANWTDFSEGLPLPYKISAIAGRREGNAIKLFAGSFDNQAWGAGIFINEYTVGIKNISSAVPEKYSLSQNYPNPFNPETKIRFEIQKASEVKLVVYNSIGKEISTLVNENLNAGTYETDFSGAAFSSGVYFYKLFISGEKSFVETRKMILTK